MLPAVWRHICRHQLAESARTRRSGDISNGPATSAAASASTAAACARRRRSPAAAHSSAPQITCRWQQGRTALLCMLMLKVRNTR